MADQAEGPPPPSPVYSWTNPRPEGPKNLFLGDCTPFLSKGLDDRPTPLFSSSGSGTGHTGLLVFLVEKNGGKRISGARYNQ